MLAEVSWPVAKLDTCRVPSVLTTPAVLYWQQSSFVIDTEWHTEMAKLGRRLVSSLRCSSLFVRDVDNPIACGGPEPNEIDPAAAY